MNGKQGRAIRRVVTGHAADGRSRVIHDAAAANVTVREATGGIVSTLLWVTDGSPADIGGTADAADRKMGVPPPERGSALRIVEFPPFRKELEATSPEAARRDWGMEQHALAGAEPRHAFIHRTRTIDYVIVLEGEISMLLDDGEVHIKAGDVLVQRGTNHAWINRSDKPCRLAMVFIDAQEPPEIVGLAGHP